MNERYVSPADQNIIFRIYLSNDPPSPTCIFNVIRDGSLQQSLTNAEFSAGRHRIVSQLLEPTLIDHGDWWFVDKKDLYCHWC